MGRSVAATAIALLAAGARCSRIITLTLFSHSKLLLIFSSSIAQHFSFFFFKLNSPIFFANISLIFIVLKKGADCNWLSGSVNTRLELVSSYGVGK